MELKKKGEWLELIISNEWNDKTIEWILREEWKVPKKLLHQLRMDKGVTVNRETFPWSYTLKAGDRFQVQLFKKEDYGVVPNFIEMDVLYEDDHVLIVNKPAGVDTHPGHKEQKDSLANAVAFYFMANGFETKVRHIHRLDKDTTGAVLFAKHALAGAIMDRMLKKREIKRSYVALVHGKLKKRKGTITESIGKDRHHSNRRRVSPTGQEATTHYEVLGYDSTQHTSIVKLELDTGRTHQIRVHMSYIGHPLVGDTLYGGKGKLPRQALHAAWISLAHPITNERIHCTAPFLDDPPIFKYDL